MNEDEDEYELNEFSAVFIVRRRYNRYNDFSHLRK